MVSLFLFASVADVFAKIGYVLIALLILLFMVTVHEFGHYTAGKLLKFKINEFSVGMGPVIFSREKADGQKVSLRALPLGGFCAFEGEDEENPSKDAFNNQAPWKRLIVLFSGAFFNFVSAVLIGILAFSVFGAQMPGIKSVYPTSPNFAETVTAENLQAGDIILEVDGKTVFLTTDLSRYLSNSQETLQLKVLRNGQEVVLSNVKKGNFTVTEEDGTEKTYYGLGVVLDYNAHVDYTFGQALTRTLPYCVHVAGYVLETLGGIVTGLIGLDQVGGPITTIGITSQVVSTGIANILYLIVLISVNLAVFNLLPIPALDGMRMVFVLIEWIRKKPVDRKVEGIIHTVGLVILLGFVILVDLLQLFG